MSGFDVNESSPPTPPSTTGERSTATAEITDPETSPVRRHRRRSASRPAGPPAPAATAEAVATAPAREPQPAVGADGESSPVGGDSAAAGTGAGPAPTKRVRSRRSSKQAEEQPTATTTNQSPEPPAQRPSVEPPVETETGRSGADQDAQQMLPDQQPEKASAKSSRSSRRKATAPKSAAPGDVNEATSRQPGSPRADSLPADGAPEATAAPLFRAPEMPVTAAGQTTTPEAPVAGAAVAADGPIEADRSDRAESEPGAGDEDTPTTSSRRRRSRGGRNRRKPTSTAASDPAGHTGGQPATSADGVAPAAASDPGDARVGSGSAVKAERSAGRPAADVTPESSAEAVDEDGDSAEEATSTASSSSSSRRRRRRRRTGDSSAAADAGGETTAKETAPAKEPETISGVEGSTRIEAKKQRRREGREAGRRRAPILSESEFLARRESVDRVMVIRQRGDVTQIGVLEDNVLVEHYVAREEQSSLIGNVYLGRVQNVLPSMEAAFIDIGKGRNAVLYAGEVNWDLIGDRNEPRRIENALKAGQQILVQVSKDPVGHKGARLTSQISLPGRYLVYVPGGGSSGISRKLPDNERNRLKTLLKDILPDDSGVIVRTAAEGASEEELRRDVTRLTSRWQEITKLVKAGKAPALLYAEPDITLKVVRDLFTEDFSRLVISGDEVWDMVSEYVSYVAPDLADRVERYDGQGDVFANFRIDEQIAKALERKVWLPSGGSLVIDRTEAMTVIDVNTGKFTGSGGNLEQTVTKNNLEAAEEIVRQLRLRDIGGIIVIDFIDMVLENNRDLVLRRLVECLGRDRTRHQVAEVTSLGLVQMTRKRIGTGLLEAFSVPCEVCHGRGVLVEGEPVTAKSEEPPAQSRSSSRRSSRSRSAKSATDGEGAPTKTVQDKHSAAVAATAAIAAALHLDPKADAASEEPDLGEGQPPVTELPAERAQQVGRAGPQPADEETAATATGAAKAPARKRSASKKSTATKKAAEPAGASATKKSSTAKRSGTAAAETEASAAAAAATSAKKASTRARATTSTKATKGTTAAKATKPTKTAKTAKTAPTDEAATTRSGGQPAATTEESLVS